jgi:glycolate oxidase
VCEAQNAREVRKAKDDKERALLWKGRKEAFAAIGRLSHSYYTQDGVVPRTKIPDTLRYVEEVGKRHGLHIGNVFHAGDGNLHPIILFDNRDADQTRRTLAAGKDILEYCIRVGGSITGEHGVGMEKSDFMPLLFTEDDLAVMARLRNALNSASILNPEKILPSTRSCLEISGAPVPQGKSRPAYPGEWL